MNDHAGTLKTMIHQRDDGSPCICAECRAVQAAIAALTRDEPHCSQHQSFETDCLECSDALERQRATLEAGRSGGSLADAANLYQQETGQELDPRAFCRAVELYAAAPQQPPPVGVTDALISLRREAQISLDRVLAEQPNNTEGNNALRARINAIQDCIDLSLSQQEAAPSVSCDKCMDTKQEFNANGDGPYTCRHCAASVSEPAAHPDALPDGTFSKSTMKRHAALRGDATSGEGLIARLEQTARDLAFHRQTHVEWHDWLAADPSRESVNPHAGSAEFHKGVTADYDRHLANITEAIRRITTTGQSDELLASVRSLGKRMAEQQSADRLAEIKQIIECVDNRAMAVDGPVPSTMQVMTQQEISRIYTLAGGKSNAT